VVRIQQEYAIWCCAPVSAFLVIDWIRCCAGQVADDLDELSGAADCYDLKTIDGEFQCGGNVPLCQHSLAFFNNSTRAGWLSALAAALKQVHIRCHCFMRWTYQLQWV
jgi:hypothetical protein